MSDLLIRLNDYPNTVTVEYCLECFQMALECSPQVKHLDAEVVATQDGFLGFRDAETQALWLGFVMGMRCYERVIRQPRDQRPITEGITPEQPDPLTGDVTAALKSITSGTTPQIAAEIKRLCNSETTKPFKVVAKVLHQMAAEGKVEIIGHKHQLNIWSLTETGAKLAHA